MNIQPFKQLARVVVAAIPLTFAIFAQAQVAPVALSRPNILAFELESQILNETMLIEVALPLSYASAPGDKEYPVAYYGDGGFMFLMVANDNLRLASGGNYLPEIITVGVDFKDYLNPCKRLQWYTATAITGHEVCGDVGGGADDYLSFLEQELKPLINAQFKTDENREVLAGHSQSGALALYSLFTNTHLFDAYIAASPSVYWANEHLMTVADEFIAANVANVPSLYLSVALNELGDDSKGPEVVAVNEALFSQVFRMHMKLESASISIPLTFQSFADEDHASVGGRAMHDGIKTLFAEGIAQ
ncbi:Ferri-bacillibactin esterase BesA [BD1-7 clade bacterium]|uniref:Ferri-bacillibactin esterase BesA n=1 Tax=BD1-7 clade bacterium TaxID=2029982 RepID=A0A5S9N5G5_9GAMM|nr:Ferri-bacillibactin esterase BesA [BD1-7 clade bacterium]